MELIDWPPACTANDLRNSTLGNRRDDDLVETADGVAIAAAVREIADTNIHSCLPLVAVPSCLTCTRSQYGARQLWPVVLCSTCASTIPYSRSARVAMHAYNRCTARLIPLSWLQEWCCERRYYVVWGGRLLSVLSRRRDLQKPNSMEVLSAVRGKGADRRWGFGASYGRDGQVFSYGVFQIISRDLELLVFYNNCTWNS